MSAVVVAGLVAAAILIAHGPTSPAPVVGRRQSSSGRRSARAIAVAAGVVVAPAVILPTRGPSAALDLVGLAGVAALLSWLVRRRRADIARRRLHEAVLGLCSVLAAELHAGLPTETALSRACGEWAEFSPVARAARLGGNVPGALRALAERPGAEGLRSIAAGWAVAAQSGASLARVLDRLVDGLRDQSSAQAEVDAALEPPRATARMLAVLPVFGVALGSAMGADPVSFLATTGPGRTCLLIGVLLALAGVGWVERLAAAASRQ